MNIKINPRGNGVCPDCVHLPSCPVHENLKNSSLQFKDPDDMGLEMVIFSCPAFSHK